MAHCVLPEKAGDHPRTVVYFDHDGRFDASRFAAVCRHRLRSHAAASPGPNGEEAKEVGDLPEEGDALEVAVTRALDRVWVIRCASTFEFVAALEVVHAEIQGGDTAQPRLAQGEGEIKRRKRK